jgi:hypothetical protein
VPAHFFWRIARVDRRILAATMTVIKKSAKMTSSAVPKGRNRRRKAGRLPVLVGAIVMVVLPEAVVATNEGGLKLQVLEAGSPEHAKLTAAASCPPCVVKLMVNWAD